MIVTSAQIDHWAETPEARHLLPQLLQRLVLGAGGHTRVDFPAGSPGWDGEVATEQIDPWVPTGQSFWECSCEKQVTGKANRDYDKRTSQTAEALRLGSTLVVVTARRWSGKKRWRAQKGSASQWKDVCALDADDLRQWLGHNSAVRLWFGEKLGQSGPGVESPERHWLGWSGQSEPRISADAFFVDREGVRDRLVRDVRDRLDSASDVPLAVKGDSVDETAAFACAAILTQPDLNVASLVITDPTGWRFVEANTNLKVAVAARPEVAENPTRRRGLAVVVPYSRGDMASRGRSAAPQPDLALERPRGHGFEEALVTLGMDEGEARWLAQGTGRSWSVLRRRMATNPAIRMPRWLDLPQAPALSSLCLLGTWSSDSVGDREIVGRVAGRTYDEVESDLRQLALADDSPVLKIGAVWKAKSPLELLDLFGDRITSDELDRLFAVAREILLAPDPRLELPDEKRWAAVVYGKVRPQSGLLMDALCDTLVKLSVRGPLISSLAAAAVEQRIAALVRELLDGADGSRWLSLSSYLQPLAEAAPEAFLRAVEHGLAGSPSGVARILAETGDSSPFGRCWHADLLWALETLAWSPTWLPRVALLLAQLSHVPLKGNWGNTPAGSLLGIFRSWLPQTAATVEERIQVLDRLGERDRVAAFELVCGLLPLYSDVAMPSHRPKWRDDDARTGYGVPISEARTMVLGATDRLLAWSKGDAARTSKLVRRIDLLDSERRALALAHVAEFALPHCTDGEKAVVRAALRERIHWHRTYDSGTGVSLEEKLGPLEDLYARIVPQDPVVRHQWLFAEGWPGNLPSYAPEDDGSAFNQMEAERATALGEILATCGLMGVERLAAGCRDALFVGIGLARLGLEIATLGKWIVERGGRSREQESLSQLFQGILCGLAKEASLDLVRDVLARAKDAAWDADRKAGFLTLARSDPSIWGIVQSCDEHTRAAYWATVSGSSIQLDRRDPASPLRQLLKAVRPRTALAVSSSVLRELDPQLLLEILESLARGQESHGPLPDSWHIGEAVTRLETSGAIARDRLARLEFLLLPALVHDGSQRAATLWAAVMSEPALFAEMISRAYRPEHDEEPPPSSEQGRTVATLAHEVLDSCHRLPGVQLNGEVDPKAFFKFVDEARELCRKADRLTPCDLKLGEILARTPAGEDGVLPRQPVRDLLDRPEFEDMRRGFSTGVFNSRGVTVRAPDEGGKQERKLAGTYRMSAKALRVSHPNLAATLDAIARSYDQQGLAEDTEARLHREGY